MQNIHNITGLYLASLRYHSILSKLYILSLWVHKKCNKINLQIYKCLQKSPSAWYCIKCFEDIVPFGTISNDELFKTNQGSKLEFTVLKKNHTSSSQDLIDQINEAMDNPSPETVSSKYYEPCEL